MIKTPKPGIHPDTPDEQYRAWGALNQSSAKEGKKSMYDLYQATQRPSAPTAAMQDGTAIHLFTLPTIDPESRYTILPESLKDGLVDGKGNTYKGTNFGALKDYKLRVETFREANPGKEIVSVEQYEMYKACSKAAWEHPRASRILEHADACEAAMIGYHQSGVLIKALLDIVAPDLNLIADIKTTDSAYAPYFRQSCKKYDYAFQAAWYLNLAKTLGLAVNKFEIIAIEKPKTVYHKPRIATFYFDDRDLRTEMENANVILEQYKQCVETGEYPDYPVESQKLTIGYYPNA